MFPLNKGYLFQCFQWRHLMFDIVGKANTQVLGVHNTCPITCNYRPAGVRRPDTPGSPHGKSPNKKPAGDPTIDISKQQPKAKAHRRSSSEFRPSTPSESAAAAAAAPPSSSSSSSSTPHSRYRPSKWLPSSRPSTPRSGAILWPTTCARPVR